jgi:hypothetical protein
MQKAYELHASSKHLDIYSFIAGTKPVIRYKYQLYIEVNIHK